MKESAVTYGSSIAWLNYAIIPKEPVKFFAMILTSLKPEMLSFDIYFDLYFEMVRGN